MKRSSAESAAKQIEGDPAGGTYGCARCRSRVPAIAWPDFWHAFGLVILPRAPSTARRRRSRAGRALGRLGVLCQSCPIAGLDLPGARRAGSSDRRVRWANGSGSRARNSGLRDDNGDEKMNVLRKAILAAACTGGTCGCGNARSRPDDLARGDAFGSEDPRSDLDHGLHRPQPRLHDLRHASRAGREGRHQAADGREVRDCGRQQELHLHAARRPVVARRKAGDVGRLHRLDQALGDQGFARSEDDDLRRFDRCGRCQDLHHQAQGTDRPRAARPVEAFVQRAVHDAQARRRDGSQQADRGFYRIRPVRLRQG